MNNINNRIKQIYIDSQLTQREFANKLSVTESYISRLLSDKPGARNPSKKLLRLIEKQFGYSFNWLKTGEGPMKDFAVSEDFSQYGDKDFAEICSILKNNLPEMKPIVLKLLRAKMMELEAMGEMRDIKKKEKE